MIRRAATILVVLSMALVAAAQSVAVRRVGILQRSGRLLSSFDVSDVLHAASRRKLKSGIPTQVVLRAYVYRDEGGSSLSLGARTCRVVFDLCEESFTVSIATRGNERRSTVRSEREVIAACTRVQELAVARLQDLEPARRYRLAVIAELNPVSQRTVQSIRRWLAHQGGNPSTEGTGLFGSFASIFVNRRIATAERTVRFQSQPFIIEAP